MTKAEAVQVLQRTAWLGGETYGLHNRAEQVAEAIRMAITALEAQDVDGDTISRQAAINGRIIIQRTNGVEIYGDEAVPVEYLKRLPSAQPELSRTQESCEYCHEDSGGYTRPIEKNCHAYIRFGMNGWGIDLKAKGWHGEAQIKFCPMCGREL